jgi:hypothetical protein
LFCQAEKPRQYCLSLILLAMMMMTDHAQSLAIHFRQWTILEVLPHVPPAYPLTLLIGSIQRALVERLQLRVHLIHDDPELPGDLGELHLYLLL